MGETGNNATVSKYENMSVEELEEAIRIFLQAEDMDENMDELLLASEVLDRKKEAMGDHIDTDAQWARFQREYLPLLNDADIEEGEAEKDSTPGAQTTENGSKSSKRKPIALRAFHAVAAAALIIMLLGLTACATIPQVRTAVVNFVINTFGSHSVALGDTNSDEVKPIDTETYELAGYVFEIAAEYELDSNVGKHKYSYCSFINNNSSVVVYVSSSDYSPVQFDTEDTEIRDITINGKEGFVIKKGSNECITWGDTENDRIIYVSGDNVQEEILLNIADTFVPLED